MAKKAKLENKMGISVIATCSLKAVFCLRQLVGNGMALMTTVLWVMLMLQWEWKSKS
jgi:hypothetical protein